MPGIAAMVLTLVIPVRAYFKLQDFITKTRQTFERFAMQGEAPVLLTSPSARPYVRSIVERFRPVTVVMSQSV